MDVINAVLELELMLSRRASFNLDRGVPLERGRNWIQDVDVICFTFLRPHVCSAYFTYDHSLQLSAVMGKIKINSVCCMFKPSRVVPLLWWIGVLFLSGGPLKNTIHRQQSTRTSSSHVYARCMR